MLDPQEFLEALEEAGVGFVAGVPDSLLKHLCAAITSAFPPERHVITANEGCAVGMAVGHYLATGAPGLVYMQNSGLGNAINPLVSLADGEVYGIPLLLLVGWRGELVNGGEQLPDEPQHITQGRITLGQLDLLNIPYQVIDRSTNIGDCVMEAVKVAHRREGPVALVVRRDSFRPFALKSLDENADLLSREEAIVAVVGALPPDTPLVSTTGMASRELFELRHRRQEGHHRDFLTVGGMGHALSIAAGVAGSAPFPNVVCLDGDGAMLMHLGGITNAATLPNLVHVLLNNGAHDSVGGQPTLARGLSMSRIARACGYAHVAEARSEGEVSRELSRILEVEGSAFLEIHCRRGARGDLGRPTRSPKENKGAVMRFLKDRVQ